MELYHNNMSVCAQKVRLVLAEKELRPTERHMNLRDGDVHRPEYLILNPKGVVPTLVDRGHVIIESTIICEYLEEAYPAHSMRPADPVLRTIMRQWTLLPDASLHVACGTVSVAIAWRHQMLAAGGAQLKNRPDLDGGNALIRDVVQNGTDSDRFVQAIKAYDYVIGRMAKSLSNNPWLVGADYSLADAAMMPYVCRLADLSLSWFWDGDRAAVGDWLERSKARSNYRGIADYLEPAYVDLATAKGLEATSRLKQILGHG